MSLFFVLLQEKPFLSTVPAAGFNDPAEKFLTPFDQESDVNLFNYRLGKLDVVDCCSAGSVL